MKYSEYQHLLFERIDDAVLLITLTGATLSGDSHHGAQAGKGFRASVDEARILKYCPSFETTLT